MTLEGSELLMPPAPPGYIWPEQADRPMPRKASSFRENRKKTVHGSSDTVMICGNPVKKSNSFKERSTKLKRGELLSLQQDCNQNVPSPSRRKRRVPTERTMHHSRSSSVLQPKTYQSPSRHARSQSVRASRPRTRPEPIPQAFELRPRTSSCPSKKQPPNYLEPDDENRVRMRCFNTTTKGEVFNRGDSIKSRSSRSISSIHSSGSLQGDNLNSRNKSRDRLSSQNSSHSDAPEVRELLIYNVLILGSTGVGKTSLINQFMTSEYQNAYEAVSVDEAIDRSKTVSVMLDGEESELTLREMHTRDFEQDINSVKVLVDAYIIIYSMTERRTFERAVDALYCLRKNGESVKATILVGNKSDLARSRAVSRDEALSVAMQYECKSIEVSAGINHKVDELLAGTLKQIRLKQKKRSGEDVFAEREKEKLPCSTGPKSLLDKIFHKKSKHLSKSCGNLNIP